MQHKKNKTGRLAACALLMLASSGFQLPMSVSAETQVMARSDATGQLLIMHEECARVMDDPSVVNRYAFESMQQYLEYCMERTSRDGDVPSARPMLASNNY